MLKELSDEARCELRPTSRPISATIEVWRGSVNAFHRMGEPGSVMCDSARGPTIDKLGLPAVLKDLVMKKRGLILVTGPTVRRRRRSPP